jgi:hypothetical protein
MGATTIILALIWVASNQIQAQDTRRSWGQVFGAAGAITESGDSEAVLHFGGGYESLLAGGAGVTGEIGYLTVFDNFSAGIGVFSVGGLYAFNRDRTTVPFVTGGYTLFFRSGTANGFFFGGGVNRWMGDKWGIRIEGRDQVFASDTGVHTIEVRFGVILK